MSRLFLLVAALCFSTYAYAVEPVDADKFGQCLMEHSNEADVENLKMFLVAALQDDTDGIKNRLGQVTATIIRISLSDCGLTVTQFEDPGFQKGATVYGELLGNKVMQDAFEKLK